MIKAGFTFDRRKPTVLNIHYDVIADQRRWAVST